jgi:ankyrin repeat protein
MLLKILREKYPDSDNWLNRRRGRQGITALHLAANSFSDNSIKILRLLWNAGADPTIQDWFGNTALHSAIRAFV